MRIGSLDPSAWVGLVLSDAPGRGFGIRFVVERGGERADWDDFLYLVHEVGPHAPDGRYARLAIDTSLPFGRGDDTPVLGKPGRKPGFTVEWSRVNASSVVARVMVEYDGALEVHGYFPWDWTGSWTAGASCLHATTSDGQSAVALLLKRAPGDSTPVATHMDKDEAVARLDVAPRSRLYLSIALAERVERARCHAEQHTPPAIDSVLVRAAADYERSRVAVDGQWSGLASSITNNVHWMVSLKPEGGQRYLPAGRRWIFPAREGTQHWTTFCWDSFLGALELAVESEELAREALAGVLETQYENGNIPNWRGRFDGTPDRSQPPVGSFAVLKSYLRTGDRSLLEFAFPYLERWSAWWTARKKGRARRDGNGNGLLEWGSDLELAIDSPAPWENRASHRQQAAWESGQDDLPNWDEAHWVDDSETLDLDAVDLNSYLALDYECLSRIAEELGRDDKAAAYRERYRHIVARVNDHLWDSERNMYCDRCWSGQFSIRLAASNFLPWIAGIPDRERAAGMLEVLQDESRFWGDFVLPTISRTDPAFEDQQYWRGTIWPPINYLVYQGLRRYGFDEVAGMLAARSVDLFLTTWCEHQLCRENYDSRTGEGGGHRYQSWGPLFSLVGLEEFIDVTPWDGLRTGTPTPPLRSTLRRIRVRGRTWTVTLSPEQFALGCDGRDVVVCDRPVVLRQLTYQNGGLSAKAICTQPTWFTFCSGASCATLEVDGRSHNLTDGRAEIPPGHHALRVWAPQGL